MRAKTLKLPSKAIHLNAIDEVPPLVVGDKPSLEKAQEYVGGYVQAFPVRYEGRMGTMLCDEEGFIKNKPINHRATKIVRQYAESIGRGPSQDIVGNVIVLLGYRF